VGTKASQISTVPLQNDQNQAAQPHYPPDVAVQGWLGLWNTRRQEWPGESGFGISHQPHLPPRSGTITTGKRELHLLFNTCLLTPKSNKQFTRTQTLDNLPVQIEVKDTMATTQCPMRQTVQENVRALAHHQTSSSPEVRQGHSSSKDKAIVFGAADLITAVETIRIPLNISVSLFSLQLPSAHGTRILFPLLNSSP